MFDIQTSTKQKCLCTDKSGGMENVIRTGRCDTVLAPLHKIYELIQQTSNEYDWWVLTQGWTQVGAQGGSAPPQVQNFFIVVLYFIFVFGPLSPINLANSIQIASTQLKLKYLNCLSMIGVTHQFVSSIVVTLLFLYIVKHLFFIKC